jgi:hypothetical protein
VSFLLLEVWVFEGRSYGLDKGLVVRAGGRTTPGTRLPALKTTHKHTTLKLDNRSRDASPFVKTEGWLLIMLSRGRVGRDCRCDNRSDRCSTRRMMCRSRCFMIVVVESGCAPWAWSPGCEKLLCKLCALVFWLLTSVFLLISTMYTSCAGNRRFYSLCCCCLWWLLWRREVW